MVDVARLAGNGELFDGRYKLLRTLSTDGGTADVWLAVDVNTRDNPGLAGADVSESDAAESGMLVAIKIYRPKSALDIEGEQRFRDEYKIVHNCRHTNLLQPTNFSICGDIPYLELPYCKNGSSERLIGKEFTEREIWKFVSDVASGLSYLHACDPPIVHQDVKPANVLIDDYRNYAISDFGISAPRGGRHGCYFDEEHSGTMAYMAPERFDEQYSPSAESDIWAFGATLYEILTGSVPYGEEGGKSQPNGSVALPPSATRIPKRVQKLILACLSMDPGQRPTADRIIEISQNRLRSGGGIAGYVAAAFVLMAIGTAGYFLAGSAAGCASPSPEAVYDRAIALLDRTDPEQVEIGVSLLDSLSRADFAPAMYELARTYGWYSDSVSLRRKRILGIDYYEEGDSKYMPISDKYNDRARELFSKLVEAGDSADPALKARAAYRLATYYNNRNDAYGQNFRKAKQYLLQSRAFAVECNDTVLLQTIDTFIRNIDAYTRNLDHN